MARPNTMRSKYLSVIIPVYNEEENLPLLHERLRSVLEKQMFTYEIIYIDDGSKDDTFARLNRLIKKDEHVQVIRFRRNFGQTAAIAAGVTHSVGEILVFMDGDLQNDPIDIPRLLAKIDEGYDVVSGWRKNRQDARWSRKFPSMLANKLISKVTGVHLNDYGCTLKAYRYEVFKHIRLYGEMHRFIPAYAALAGASITEIAVNHHARQFGTSKYGISRVIRVLLDLMTLKFLGSFGTKPLYAFGVLGLSSLSVGVVVSCYALSQRVLFPHVHIRPARREQVGLPRVGILGKEVNSRRDRGFARLSDPFPHEKPLSAPAPHTLAGSPEALSLHPPKYLPLRGQVGWEQARWGQVPHLQISLLFSGFGLLSIMMGLLAELLMRTYYEAQDKPTYVVKHFLSGSRETINDELLPKLKVLPRELGNGSSGISTSSHGSKG